MNDKLKKHNYSHSREGGNPVLSMMNMKYKFVKGLIWTAIGYFLFTSITSFEMAIQMLDALYLIDSVNNYFLVSWFRLFFSLVVFFWTSLALFYYFKRQGKFKSVFINVCIIYGFSQSLYAPIFYYKSADPNYFNYFLWAPSWPFYENLIKSLIVFFIAILASKYLRMKKTN